MSDSNPQPWNYGAPVQAETNLAQNPKAKPTVTLSRKTVLIAAGAITLLGLVVGTMLGASAGSGASGAAEPQPVETVTVEVPVAAENDPICATVAAELRSILQVATDDVMIRQNEVIQVLVENLQYGFDLDSIEQATSTIQGVTATTNGLTDRINAITTDYDKCVNP